MDDGTIDDTDASRPPTDMQPGTPQQRTTDGPAFEPDRQGRIHGLKVARLIQADDGTTRFAGLAASSVPFTFYDAEGTAHCGAGKPHRAPAWSCSCGFHVAYDRPSLDTMYPDWDQGMFVLMDVETWGTIVEHDHGYRAQHQRILGIQVSERCTFCSEPTDRLGTHSTSPGDGFRYGTVEQRHLVPVCARCAPERTPGPLHSYSDVAGMLGVEVTSRPGREHRRRKVTDDMNAALWNRTAFTMFLVAATLLLGAGLSHLRQEQTTYAGILTGAAFTAALLGTLIANAAGTRRKAGMWAGTATTAAAALAAVTLSATPIETTAADTTNWYQAVEDVATNLDEDPFIAARTAATKLPGWTTIILGETDVRGLMATQSTTPSRAYPSVNKRCVIVIDGNVTFAGTSPEAGCLARADDELRKPPAD